MGETKEGVKGGLNHSNWEGLGAPWGSTPTHCGLLLKALFHRLCPLPPLCSQGQGLSTPPLLPQAQLSSAEQGALEWAQSLPSAWGIPPQAPEAWQETGSWAPEAAPGQASPQEQRQQEAKHHCQQEDLVVCGQQGKSEYLAGAPP